MLEIKASAEWTDETRKLLASGQSLSYPSETLVRILKGNYIPGIPKKFDGLSALDVGFGAGNNLRLLRSLGMHVSGTEISADLCGEIGAILKSDGISADLRVGKNTSLPFDDRTFDFLVSWNVLHYEETEEEIIRAIKEYARVLKVGGRLLLSTTGPKHKILEGAQTLGGHRYQIGRSDDFRKGTVYFYFDAENYVKHYFGISFDNVMTGRTHDRLFTETLDWFIVTGTACG